MTMPGNIPITDFRQLDETNKSLLMWQGLTDTWNKLQETIDHQKEIEADTRVHQKLLITGNGEPAIMERIRSLETFVKDVRYWVRLVIGLLVAQFITFTTASVIAYVKFLPVLERLAAK